MRLLLITGAGASRNLNLSDTQPIALMDGWVDALRSRFGDSLSGLIGLNGVSNGEDFEELLGELTRWLQLKELNSRFAAMTSGTDEGRDAIVDYYQKGLSNAARRGQLLQDALDETLFEQFGPGRFDSRAAAHAYETLLRTIGGNDYPEAIICATTNYDRSLEVALEVLGMPARTGFSYGGIQRPILSARGLGTFERQPSMLYLHGAVGWYRDPEGSVVAYPATDPFFPQHGKPAVLYPSHNKTVEDGATADIWLEFDQAVANATHILVLGHGLADSHLVRRLKDASGVAVTYHSDKSAKKIGERLPGAFVLQMDFSSEVAYDVRQLAAWAKSISVGRKRTVTRSALRHAGNETPASA